MNCRVCHWTNVEPFLDLGEQPPSDALLLTPDQPERRYPLVLAYCHDCTLVQLTHTVPKEELFGNGQYPYVSGTTATLRRHFQETAQRLTRQYDIGPNDWVVDLGSNDGTLLQCFGARVLGIDPSGVPAPVPTLRAYFNEQVAREFVADNGHAKLVTATGVLFHLEDLDSFMEGVRILIGDEGVFVAQVIDWESVRRELAWDQIYHEHLLWYTRRTLDELLGRHDLWITSVTDLPVHGGSLEVHAGTETTCVPPPPGDTFADCRQFSSCVHRRIAVLREAVLGARAEGPIFLYGAAAKSATLVNSCGLTSREIDCAVEANPRKFGRYMPGSHIPIVDERQAPRPATYLLGAWNYRDEILAKERDYTGKWIIPVPEVEVLG